MPSPIRVLYVDDEPDLLDLAKLFLEVKEEFFVTTLTSGRAALDQLNTERYDAIISDYQMPGMDGIEFLVEVRARFGPIPFILFTGRGREEVVIQAINSGVNFYIQKGGDPKSQFADLSHKIRKAVDHRRADMLIVALNRLYAVLSATNKAIVRIHNKSEILEEICRIVVDIGGFRMAWAGLVNPEKHTIESVAANGYIDGYLDTIAISTDDSPKGRGPTGTAYRARIFNVSNDIANDPNMEPWREGALKRGYRSLAAFPFALDTKSAGVITFYASEPGFFTDPIIRLLDEQTSDLSFAFITLDHEEQRKSAEKDLIKSELQYRRLFETSQDAILILDGDTGEIIDANMFILDMLGYTQEYFVGKHLWELGFIKDKSIAQQAFRDLKTKGYIRYEGIPLETKDGRSIDIDFLGNVYRVGEKEIFQCIIRDISNRKVLQDALQASELQYRRLFETTQEGIIILDAETGQIVEVNPSLIGLLGFPREQFLKKKIWEIGLFKDIVTSKDNFKELQQQEYVHYEDLPLETADGRHITVEFLSNAYTVNNRVIQCNIRDNTKRKQAEEAQIASEIRYRRLFETTQEGIIILDAETGQIVEVNPFLIDLLGFSREQFLEMKIWEIGLSKDIVANKDNFKELQQQEYIRYEDLPLKTADGRSIDVEFISNSYLIGNKKIIQCDIRDITDRKVIQDALHEVAHYTRSLLEVSLDPLVTISPEGKITDVNAATEEVTGHSRDHLIGTDFVDYFTDPENARAGYRKAFDEDSVRDYPLVIRHADGKITSVLYNARIYRDESGTVKGVFAAARDVTDKKVIQDALQASEIQYRRLFETAQDAILILDGETGEIIDANTFILDMLGYPLEYFIGKHLWELGFIRNKSIAQQAFTKLKTNNYIRYEDIPLETKDGRCIDVEFISNVYHVGDKKIIQCDIRDNTERKRAEGALALASRKLNLLSGITRHDINNQLTILLGYLTILQKQQPDTTHNEYFLRVSTAAQRISTMIRFSKDYEEIGVNAPAWQDCRTLVDSSAKEVHLGQVVVKNDLPSCTAVFADPLIVKVFYNLMDNAVQYGGKITTIRFAVEESSDNHIIVCEDDGEGIRADEKEKIFERGYGKNTGLGLALSREILDITGIMIKEAGEPGKGARFEMTVPKGMWRRAGKWD
jgi:PAS domain S-box-containing protein